jgi:hypothetical protein
MRSPAHRAKVRNITTDRPKLLKHEIVKHNGLYVRLSQTLHRSDCQQLDERKIEKVHKRRKVSFQARPSCQSSSALRTRLSTDPLYLP